MLLLNIIAFANIFYFSVVSLQAHDNYFKESWKYLEPPLASVRGEIVKTKWIEQRVNNFDLNDESTWQMRYMENDFFLKENGTIFIFVGGEIEIVEGWLLGGYLRDMAVMLEGAMFYVEHRYYGESRPTADMSAENLQFLTVDQALADLAQFILHIKQTNILLTHSPVILVGASYAAALTTWFMQEYPEFAQGAWVSSAPLNAQVDFFEYREVVSSTIEIVGGEICSLRIKRAFDELERLIASNESIRVENLFNLCFPLDLSNQLDVWNFFSVLTNSFSSIVQTQSELNQNIQGMCSYLNDNDIDSDIEVLSRWLLSQDTQCFNHLYSSYVKSFNQTNWGDNQFWFGVRQWTYQTCSEFGWIQTTNSNKTLFGSSVSLQLQLQVCADFFGLNYSLDNIQRNVDRTNTIYRGRNPNVRNVYSTHGQFDPWHPMGVQKDINPNSPTVILPSESHCSDLYSISSTDSPELRASKERILELVQQWILQ